MRDKKSINCLSLFSQPFRNFTQLNRSSNILRGNVQTFRGKTPFRFQSNGANDRIEQELAQQIRQPMNITHLVRPFIFTVGVSFSIFHDHL